MKILLLLLIVALTACHTPRGGYRDVRYETDMNSEVPPGGDGANRVNGPVAGPF